MLDNNPDQMCYNALMELLDSFDDDESIEVDTTKMRHWVEEKKNRKGVQVYILPLNPEYKKILCG